MQTDNNIISDINLISEWLSWDEWQTAGRFDADLIVLAGHAVVPAILGVLELAVATGIPLLLTGGVGHSTPLLKQALAENRLTRLTTFDRQSEADIIFTLATDCFGISPSQLYVENRSANCGQNADFTRDMIAELGLRADNIILSQDPLMQRRTRETFAFSWQKKGLKTGFINWPVFVPRLVSLAGNTVISGAQSAGIWNIERFISMVLGEMRRLQDDASGYGPNGAGYIGHVDIPRKVSEARQRIMAKTHLAHLIRA
ncbi:YdcF family protein [Erwiniaceae bacterium CAU 1747]